MGGTEPRPDVEVEWQFDALDLRPVERWLAALPSRTVRGCEGLTLTALAKPVRRLVDRYVDTDDWRIGRAGFVLRTRRHGRSEEATIKDLRPAGRDGLRERLEVTETLPPAGIASLGPNGPVGRRLKAVAGHRPLQQVLEVRTRRQPFSLRAAGNEVAELALDDTAIVVGGGQRPAHLRRVEVEVTPEWVHTLAPLVEELRTATGLRPATLSKFEAGLLAAGLEIPGPPDLGPTESGPGSSFGDLAFAVLRKQLRVLFANEPGTRLGEDIEHLHDMRVATRRLRAAMEMFAEALPVRAQALRAELKWLADVLGRVRDLDVQLDGMGQMAEWSAGWAGSDHDAPLEHLRALLESEREAARRDLLDALDSPRWDRLAAGLIAMARHGPNRRLPPVRQPAVTVVPDLVVARHRAVAKAARRARRTGVADDFHRLRIRCKRLRYSLEFTASLYDGRTERFTRRLAKLQDSLGLMQDAEVATVRLYGLATGHVDGQAPLSPDQGAVPLPVATVFVMGGIAEHYRRVSAEYRASLGDRLTALTGSAWHDLESVMQRKRRAAAVVAPPTTFVPPAHRGTPPPPTDRTPNASDAPAEAAIPELRPDPASPTSHLERAIDDFRPDPGSPESQREPATPETQPQARIPTTAPIVTGASDGWLAPNGSSRSDADVDATGPGADGQRTEP